MQDEPNIAESQPAEVFNSISWEASEYEHHDKDFTWTLLLVAITTFLSALTYFILEDKLSVLVIILMAVAIGVYGHREPHTLTYRLSEDGVAVSGRQHSFEEFKSYSLIEDGSMNSIVFEPLKRLMPPISIYFLTEDEDKITQILNSYLPYKQHTQDFVEKMFKRLRF